VFAFILVLVLVSFRADYFRFYIVLVLKMILVLVTKISLLCRF